jgi:hypothetical protein
MYAKASRSSPTTKGWQDPCCTDRHTRVGEYGLNDRLSPHSEAAQLQLNVSTTGNVPQATLLSSGAGCRLRQADVGLGAVLLC